MITSRLMLAGVGMLSVLSLGACAHNYAVEGAAGGAALAAAAAAATGEDVVKYALAGAAAGGLAGYFVDKNDGCDGYDRNGYLDDDCFGTRGYPADPRRRR